MSITLMLGIDSEFASRRSRVLPRKRKKYSDSPERFERATTFFSRKGKGSYSSNRDKAFLQSLAKQPLISGFFEDFKIKEEEGKTYLYLTNSKAKITELADQFNRLALNSQKIDEVQYQADKQQLFFLLQENQQLSPISEPIKTFLADETYDAALRLDKHGIEYLNRSLADYLKKEAIILVVSRVIEAQFGILDPSQEVDWQWKTP